MSDSESDADSFFEVVEEKSANINMQDVLEQNKNDKKLIDP